MSTSVREPARRYLLSLGIMASIGEPTPRSCGYSLAVSSAREPSSYLSSNIGVRLGNSRVGRRLPMSLKTSARCARSFDSKTVPPTVDITRPTLQRVPSESKQSCLGHPFHARQLITPQGPVTTYIGDFSQCNLADFVQKNIYFFKFDLKF